ncbi:MAG: aspartate--tRNA(Asn) ligase, partial [Desulfurococcaceae archaeon]
MERKCGWVIRKVAVGKVLILETADDTVKINVLVLKQDRDPELYNLAKNIDIGTALCFEGQVSETQRSKRG